MSDEDRSAPALGKAAFNCPHCGALAQQQWLDVHASYRSVDDPAPPTDPEHWETMIRETTDPDSRRTLQSLVEARLAPAPRLENRAGSPYKAVDVVNVALSKCFACREIALWQTGRVVVPATTFIVRPNPDLPDEVLREFVEAGSIFSTSPKGAAALLRLAIQRLCIHLGKSGSVDKMIGDLVADGLSPRVQKALDIVRVIGNESVHPGTIDVNDTPQAAEQLFQLVNIIAEKMISEPKHIDAVYAGLPPEKLAGIEARNRKALAAPKDPAD